MAGLSRISLTICCQLAISFAVSVNVNQTVDWSRSNKDLAKEFRVSPVTVWRYKRKIGIKSTGKRGCVPLDRSHWDWSIRDIDLARLHKISRQRVGVLRRRQNQIGRKLRAQNGKQSGGAHESAGTIPQSIEAGGVETVPCSPCDGNPCVATGESLPQDHQSTDAVAPTDQVALECGPV